MFSTRVNRSIDCSNGRNSIGNGFPVQKYVGAMVRKSIRVVLVAENDLLEVAGDPAAGEGRVTVVENSWSCVKKYI